MVKGVKLPREYMCLSELCKNYEVNYRWDPLVKKITLTRNSNSVSTIIGTALLLVDGKSVKTNQKVYIKGGEIWLSPAVLRNLYIKRYIDEGEDSTLLAGMMQIKTIVIDAGHGGRDPGAVSRIYGLREKDINLDIAQRLKRILNHYGVEVIMTRNRDTFVSLDQRTRIAMRSQSDIFISIHANASRSRNVRGFEIYCFPDYLNNSSQVKWAVDNHLRPAIGLREVSLKGLNYKQKMLL